MRFILALLLTTTPALAAPKCAAHDDVAASLATKYSEVRRSIGMVRDGSMMEIYAAPDTGTWTMTITLPNGQTCLIAAGDKFETVPVAPQGDPA